MRIDRICREQDALTSGTPNLGKVKESTVSAQMSPKPVPEELAELVRELHDLLRSYSPMWYTEDMDARVCATLARVEWALRKTR